MGTMTPYRGFDGKGGHGTPYRYNAKACRCKRCRKAWALYCYEHRSSNPGGCTVDGCEGNLYAKGLCRAHYERKRTGRRLDTTVIRRNRKPRNG